MSAQTDKTAIDARRATSRLSAMLFAATIRSGLAALSGIVAHRGIFDSVRMPAVKARFALHISLALALACAIVLALGPASLAADDRPVRAKRTAGEARAFPVKAVPPVQAFDWTGLYIGAHTGLGRTSSRATLWDPAASTASAASIWPVGGVQVGYNVMFPSRLLLGVEADITFPNYHDYNGIISSATTPASNVVNTMDYVATLRGRIGYAAMPWMVYATAGFALAGERYVNRLASGFEEILEHRRPGWVAGLGAEYAFAPHWSARLEYLYSRFPPSDVRLPSGLRYASTMDFQTVRVGLNRRIDPFGVKPSSLIDPESDRWEIHGQTTYLGQGYPAFRAPYGGDNSLSPGGQYKSTWSSSLYLNVRLWDGGEVYYNPELLQGFGLSDTTGLAGFSSGEAQKSNFPYPRYNASRLYLRQTFGLGGEQEQLASGPNQLAGKVDVSRVTVQAGKFAVVDVFDGNSYARDPRRDFMNWSIWSSGAFDYAGDKLGLTYGVAAELNQKSWAVRGGYFLVSDMANSNNFDSALGRRGSYVAELETRHSIFGRAGKLRLLGFVNSTYSGSYRETLDNPALNLDIALTRRGRIKYGYAVNLEQEVTDDIGLFGRWSWNDGRNEIMAFTDIDASLAGGVSIKGASWGRPDDVIGLAGAVNFLSRDHRDYIAAGGLGILIGDGALNYKPERIFEGYYAFALTKQVILTADYQLITNPAYNADRGPVSIFSGRLHGEF